MPLETVTQGLFVTGTDTHVGKSLVACAIVRLLREQALDAVGFKPVATGEVGGSWGDAEALYEASGGCEPIEKICPQRFALPLAPTLAAAREGIEPDMSLARTVFVHLCVRHTVVIVEGVGGVLVPLDRSTLVLDFAGQVGFPLLIVSRAGLGTINHTLLTVREIERCKMPIAGIILNVTDPMDAGLAHDTKEEIERIGGNKVLAVIPFLGQEKDTDAPRAPLVARAVASLVRQVDFRSLLGTEGMRKTYASGRFRRRRAGD